MLATRDANGKVNQLQHDLHTLRYDVAKLALEIPSVLSDVKDDSLRAARVRLDRMKDNIDASLAQFNARGREAAQALGQATDEAARGMEEALHAHPIATIVFAFGIGCVLGASMRR
jgi:ElaB/YqjD/DUF883 family membrane-anchored ribosome-binding protein